MNQIDLAISAYKNLLNTDPKNGVAHFELGKLYQNIGENQLAIFHSMKAEEIFVKVLGAEFWRVVEAQKRIAKLNMSQKNLLNDGELVN